MCVSVLPACMYEHRVHAWGLRRSEEGISCPGRGVTEAVSHPVDAGHWTLVLPEATSVLNHWANPQNPWQSLETAVFPLILWEFHMSPHCVLLIFIPHNLSPTPYFLLPTSYWAWEVLRRTSQWILRSVPWLDLSDAFLLIRLGGSYGVRCHS